MFLKFTINGFLIVITMAALFITACSSNDIATNIDEMVEENNTACTITSTLEETYQDDAKRLTVRWMGEQSRVFTEVNIDNTLLTNIRSALIAVHNFNHDVRDTIFNLYNIKAYPYLKLDEIELVIDVTEPWLEKLINNDFPTANLEIDQLQQSIGLQMLAYNASQNTVRIKTDEVINIHALCEIMIAQRGVSMVNQIANGGDGSNIQLRLLDNGEIDLLYSYGFENCDVVCANRHFWSFSVDTDCTVTYVSSYGDNLP